MTLAPARRGRHRVAVALDRLAWPEITGTIAGDDTIFIAVRYSAAQGKVLRQLRRAIRPG